VAEKNQGGKIPDDALTVREAASITGRSVATVQNWMKQRKLLAFYRLTAQSGIEALVSRADVERVVESQRGPGVAAHERAMQRHASKIPMAVDLIRSGVLKKHACASVGIPVTTLNLWRRTSRTLESGVSLLAEVKDATESALDDKRQALAARMARMVGAVKAGATVREAAKEMGESEDAPGLWLHGLSGCEDLCARFRVEWAAAKKQGHERRQKDKAPRHKAPTRYRARAGWVYFIQDADARGNIKIGFTAHTVETRLAQLSIGSPVRLVAIRKVRAPRAFEGWAHERFNEERQHGEWFRPSPRLLMFIQRLADHPDLTLTDPSVIQGLSQGNPLFYEVPRAAT
jgi:transposase